MLPFLSSDNPPTFPSSALQDLGEGKVVREFRSESIGDNVPTRQSSVCYHAHWS